MVTFASGSEPVGAQERNVLVNPVCQVVVDERREPVLPELGPHFVHSVHDERQHFFAAEGLLPFTHGGASQLVQQFIHRRRWPRVADVDAAP